jgi:hypothetical protein
MVPHPPVLVGVVAMKIFGRGSGSRAKSRIALQNTVRIDAPGFSGVEIGAALEGVYPIQGFYGPFFKAEFAFNAVPGIGDLSR